MRLALLFPLAFVSGMDGFLLFAPYLMLIVMIGHILVLRKLASQRVAATVNATVCEGEPNNYAAAIGAA